MKPTPKIGDVYWIIKGSMESACYEDHDDVPPRRMKIVREQGGSGPDLFVASHLNQDGSVDLDSNASCYVTAEDCHDSWKAAVAAYVAFLDRRCRSIVQGLEEAAREHEEWRGKLDDMGTDGDGEPRANGAES